MVAMRKIVVDKPGGYQRLQIQECPTPKPKNGEVLIACKACGVNFADCCVRMGVYSSAKVYAGWPITPGFEVAGKVIAVGEGVSKYKNGDKVMAVTRFGGYTSHLIHKENQVFPLPPSLSYEEGAAFPAVFLTAYYGLIELTHPRPGSTILIHSAAGGVGSALVQLGKVTGGRVIGVVGASHKVQYVQDLGADLVIDKSKEAIWTRVEEFAPRGVDIVLDANGRETLRAGYDHLCSGGWLVIYGFHTMLSKGRGTPNWFKVVWDYLRTPRFNPLNLTTDNRGIVGYNLSYLFEKIDLFQEIMAKLIEWVEQGKIVAPIVTMYPFDEVAAAHKDLELGQTTGKLVLSLNH